MKVTLANGSVFEGTYKELKQAGLIPATGEAAQIKVKAKAKVEYREGTLADRVASAIRLAATTRQTQKLSVRSHQESSVRSAVYKAGKELGIKASACKSRIGRGFAMAISV